MKHTIRELAPKPSDAILAMVRGMRNQMDNPDFEVDMSAWIGAYSDGETAICYGCAATCAVMELTGQQTPTAEEIWEMQEDVFGKTTFADLCTTKSYTETQEFEMMIDHIRQGRFGSIYEFYFDDGGPPSEEWGNFKARFDQLRAERGMTHGAEVFTGNQNKNDNAEEWRRKLDAWEYIATKLKKEGF